MPVSDNPKQGLVFECDSCDKKLPLEYQGRTREEVEDRAKQLGWTIIDPNKCFCPAHRPAES